MIKRLEKTKKHCMYTFERFLKVQPDYWVSESVSMLRCTTICSYDYFVICGKVKWERQKGAMTSVTLSRKDQVVTLKDDLKTVFGQCFLL